MTAGQEASLSEARSAAPGARPVRTSTTRRPDGGWAPGAVPGAAARSPGRSKRV